MWALCLCAAVLVWCVSAQLTPGTPAYYQLEAYSNSTKGNPGLLTTWYGAPVPRRQADSSVDDDFLTNPHFMEEIFHFGNERIPQRVINAKGAGAFGEFVVTHDVTHITNVAMLDRVGKKTPVFTRFSSVLSDRGTPDTIRNPYGFATKFYTEEGNWDFTGFTTDTFTIKDPMFMPAGCRAGFRNAATNLPDASGFYDFLLSFDTSVSILTQFLGDMGVPASYRHMPVETAGCWGQEAKQFAADIGRRLREAGHDPRSGSFLVQKLSLAIQRGNAASIMGTFAPGTIRGGLFDS